MQINTNYSTLIITIMYKSKIYAVYMLCGLYTDNLLRIFRSDAIVFTWLRAKSLKYKCTYKF